MVEFSLPRPPTLLCSLFFIIFFSLPSSTFSMSVFSPYFTPFSTPPIPSLSLPCSFFFIIFSILFFYIPLPSLLHFYSTFSQLESTLLYFINTTTLLLYSTNTTLLYSTSSTPSTQINSTPSTQFYLIPPTKVYFTPPAQLNQHYSTLQSGEFVCGYWSSSGN